MTTPEQPARPSDQGEPVFVFGSTEWALKISKELEQKSAYILKLQKEFEERTVWAKHLVEEVKSRDTTIRRLQKEFQQERAAARGAMINSNRKEALFRYLQSTSQEIVLSFQCKICGAENRSLLALLDRDPRSCQKCGSNARDRALIEILAQKLFGKSTILPQFAENRGLRGLGMTDSGNYASVLAKKFSYQNTFLHQEPKLDITAAISDELLESCDFVLSCEVFEHVHPPVQRAFENVFHLLKPGGLFVLTVPYGGQPKTMEHFPELHDFSIEQAEGKYVLINRTPVGVVQKFYNLIFHGGPGETLEMRLFSEEDLLNHLKTAGFTDVEVHHEPCFTHGIWWPDPISFPISGRKP